MNIQSYLILALLAAAVVWILFTNIRAIQKGKNKCSSCPVTACPLCGTKNRKKLTECRQDSTGKEHFGGPPLR